MNYPVFSPCFPNTNFPGQLRWYPESVRWYPTHVTWVDIRGSFKYTTCSYVGFSSPILGYTQRENFSFKFHRLTARECIIADAVLM